MSDNGIFILETLGSNQKPEYRVTYANSAIEKIFGDFDKDGDSWKGDPQAIREFFGNIPHFIDKDTAVNAAMMLIQKANIVESDEMEFGIVNITDFRSKTFQELVK